MYYKVDCLTKKSQYEIYDPFSTNQRLVVTMVLNNLRYGTVLLFDYKIDVETMI